MSQITKHALEASLKNILLKKPLNKITVKDIADDCGINRMAEATAVVDYLKITGITLLTTVVYNALSA